AGEPVALSHALLQRSRTRGHLGDSQEAEHDLTEARHTLELVRDDNLRQRNLAELRAVESDLIGDRDPSRAAAALSLALDYYGRKNNHFALSRLYLARARAELTEGDDEQAEADLDRGIAEVESQRRRVPNESYKISYFEHSRALFDTMINLQAGRRNNAGRALDYVERERARALLDRLEVLNGEQQDLIIGHSIEPLRSEEIRQNLPDGIAVAEYALLGDRLLIWVIRSDGLFFHTAATDAFRLQQMIRRLRSGLEHRATAGEASSPSAWLFDRLIRPVLPYLGPVDRIVFVPDKILHAVPFAALRDRKTGRYLIQDRVIGVAPSATLYYR